jgi:hypothetical protein
MKGPELRYSMAEKICLSLVFAVQKFRHYFLAHEIHLVSKRSPVKYLLTKPLLSGRTVKWALTLFKFDIKCIGVATIKGQAMTNLLANFSGTKELELPREEIMIIEEVWQMYFDG